MADTTTSQLDLETLAKLAGFDGASSPSSPTQTTSQTDEKEETHFHISIEEDTEETEEAFTPLIPPEELEENVSIDQWSFTPNRINKVALFSVAVVISVLIGFFTTFNQQASTETESEIASEIVPITEDIKTDPTTEQLGEAQTDLALGEQERQLEQLNKSSVKPPRPKQTRSAPPPQPVQPQPVKVATPPPPRPPRRLGQPVAVRPISRPVPPPAPTPPPVPISADVVVEEEPSVDPQTAWLEAANAGTMGGSSHHTPRWQGRPGGPGGPGDKEDFSGEQSPKSLVSSPSPMSPMSSPYSLVSSQSSLPLISYDPNLEAPVLEGRPRDISVIPANTRMKGILLEAIAWDDPRLVVDAPVRIALSEAIVGEEGQSLLPHGTEVIAVVQQARPSGLVMLTVTGIEYPTETEYRSISVDPGIISIKLTNGMPLMAQRMQQGGQQPGVDPGGLFLDVLGATLPILSGGSGNPYRDMYQLNRVQQVYSRHFSQPPQGQNYYTPPTQTFWFLPRDLEVELTIRKPIRIFENSYDY